MATASKGMMVFFLGAILLCSLMVTSKCNPVISYGSINAGDRIPGNPKVKPVPVPANPYSRGCEKVAHCRGGNEDTGK
ncbi:hypothetical protein RHGRI_009921 [Rhododendron griersonianum]|uniref:Rapid ALkalinization Factor n=1 Tax=Rhododendron griersonianum TaxID=479676 RepID=A0AAV6KGK4_9ERIC|nr:hypothetical protein RHGRI_009921 [Rhododendron griersonianum]